MGTVACIHADLRTMYNTVYRRARDDARDLFGDATLDQLHQAREEMSQPRGCLSIRQRAWQQGQQDVLDDLIEKTVLGDTATR
jgi:hypothetical protein